MKNDRNLPFKEQGMREGQECSIQKDSTRRSEWKREYSPTWGPEIMTFRQRKRSQPGEEFELEDKGWLLGL